jgi:hypothetical protein
MTVPMTAGSNCAEPRDVLQDPHLTVERKRDMLRRWALDAYEVETKPSATHLRAVRLQEVIDALLDLEEPHINGDSFQHVRQHVRKAA